MARSETESVRPTSDAISRTQRPSDISPHVFAFCGKQVMVTLFERRGCDAAWL